MDYFRAPKTEERTIDFSNLIKFKEDYKYKPVIAVKSREECPRIILETFTDYYKEIVEFLVAIGEPIVRTKNFQEYELNTFSLYSAASRGIDTDEIIEILEKISKNYLQEELKKFIIDKTRTYGMARLILKNNRYFIKCRDSIIMNKLRTIQEVAQSHRKLLEEKKNIKPMDIEENNNNNENKEDIPNEGKDFLEIYNGDFGIVRDACQRENYPLLEEFDFKAHKGLELKITPKFKSPIRSYQEKALNIMCNNGLARSGIIVLPCGAGKTLVGILAICTIKRNTIIICNNNVAVQQWYNEINDWVNISGGSKERNVVCRFTSNRKYQDPLWNAETEAGILITSYTMISCKKKRNPKVQEYLDILQKKIDWGLMIIDEVQLLPAETFSEIVKTKYKSHCKLGLTATLVREDNKIKDLHFLIGPKHYEANWLDLQKEGFLARVKCTEIWCEMHPKFYEIYLTNPNSEKKKVLYVSNPIKYLATLILLEKHKGEKIIIFSDNLFTINQYDKFLQERILRNSRNNANTNINQNDISLNYRRIDGDTNPSNRDKFLKEFKNNNKVNILLMTKVGDISIDIPNASVIIQVSSHFGSRMQEAQRFGRILRPKKDALSEYNAFFYTIVSKNTEEMAYSNKRHRFLVDQGYYFNVVTKLEEIFDNKEELKEKDLINKFENDRNYTKYVDDTYKLINEKNEFRNDYNDEENSFDILNNIDEEEMDKDNKIQ